MFETAVLSEAMMARVGLACSRSKAGERAVEGRRTNGGRTADRLGFDNPALGEVRERCRAVVLHTSRMDSMGEQRSTHKQCSSRSLAGGWGGGKRGREREISV